MNKTLIPVGIAAVVVAISIAYGAIANPGVIEKNYDDAIWNFRISGEEFNDISTIKADLGVIEGGTYKIGFVPMGDSPAKIKLTMNGKWTETYNVEPSWEQIFSEEFVLEKSLVDTGISKYYTWEYNGDKSFFIPKSGSFFDIKITVQGNMEGSVSISLTKVAESI